jgi:hypothetical protein
MNMRRERFRLSDDPDGQVLLALVLVLGRRPGVSASAVWDALRAGRKPLHPSIDYEWESSYFVSRVLARLRERGLVSGAPRGRGAEPVWRATQRGYDWLCGRLLPGAEGRAA